MTVNLDNHDAHLDDGSASLDDGSASPHDVFLEDGDAFLDDSDADLDDHHLSKRHIRSSANCGRCGYPEETVMHCLWQCPKDKHMWKLTWLRSVVKIWSEPSFIDLLCHVAAKGELQASKLFHKVVEWIKEWSIANVNDQKPLQSSDNDADSLIWEAPPPSWVKLHFDGACDVKNGRVGIGAVVLDEFERMQGALAVPVDGTLSRLATEAAALRYGILYCKELGFTRVEIEGDALNVLKALHSNGFDLSEIRAIIEGVKHVMVEMEIVKWKHVRKKYN
ncbi:uncharacterized protein LOC121052859 [Rosa chinensis]|uniref:uncharacterized protein LOC121052859 n=1 Tax=Rosa chinensis TaxID=74649 RepID=UPI001AD8F3D8|nr:uncharacterized protein LOC121052859 [Rosa chinensis]